MRHHYDTVLIALERADFKAGSDLYGIAVQRLSAELPGILLWALDGLDRLTANG